VVGEVDGLGEGIRVGSELIGVGSSVVGSLLGAGDGTVEGSELGDGLGI